VVRCLSGSVFVGLFGVELCGVMGAASWMFGAGLGMEVGVDSWRALGFASGALIGGVVGGLS